jgi:hypothetical protein
MDIVGTRNIGAYAVVVPGIAPQSSTGGTINGTGIDRQAHSMADSCIVYQSAGAITGAPSAASVVTTLQHSSDNSTWSNYTDPNTNAVASTAALSAQNTSGNLAVCLTSAKRYIRAVTVVTLTGGTSPAALVGVDLVLAGEDRLAAT